MGTIWGLKSQMETEKCKRLQRASINKPHDTNEFQHLLNATKGRAENSIPLASTIKNPHEHSVYAGFNYYYNLLNNPLYIAAMKNSHLI